VNAALPPAQVARLIASILKRFGPQRVIGIHSVADWTGGQTLPVDDEQFDVAACGSELEIRELLCSPPADAPTLVIITSLAETELAQDVLARLARRRLYRVDRWNTLREVFGVRRLDARIGRSTWLVDAVLALPAKGAPQPAAGDFLSEDILWEFFLSGGLGFDGGRPDLIALLEWSVGRDVIRFDALAPEAKRGLRERIGETAGGGGVLVLDAVAAGFGRDALALGLVLDVVCGEAAADAVALAEARGRLERFVGNSVIDDGAARAWARAACDLVRRRSAAGRAADVSASLHRADEIAAQLGIADHLWRSAVLPGGADRRLARLGAAIAAFLDDPTGLGEVRDHARAARAHDLLQRDAARLQTVEMVERLCRYLTTPPVEDLSFANAALRYAREGGLVDLAVNAVAGGDPQATFSRAVERLRSRVLERCEADARSFAEQLRGWTEADGARDHVVPIEEVLDRVVAPIVERAPVLLLVLDGMSAAVFQELAADLTSPAYGWAALCPAGDVAATIDLSAPPVIAGLPTLTEVSRASLFCGELTSGVQLAEKKGFAAHPGLRRAGGGRKAPILFHKAELSGRRETDLAEEVREAIIGSNTAVVGVTLNAVDDFLARSDQLRHAWRIDSIHFLAALLEAADTGGRVVVVTSDHGHVLDTGSERAIKGDADRFRLHDAALIDGEVVLAGRRVAPSVGGRLVAAWSRNLRYAGKKNGYHGGASPQEVIVPLGVFAPPSAGVEGWRETGLYRPAWWIDQGEAAPAVKTAPAKARPRKPAPMSGQQDLFAGAGTTDGEQRTVPTWVEALVASEIFRQQIESAGRIAPSEEQIRQVLSALGARGNKLTRAALVQQLDLPANRVRGIVNGLRVVLNVDGYDVLEIDDSSDSLAINLALLDKQFELGEG